MRIIAQILEPIGFSAVDRIEVALKPIPIMQLKFAQLFIVIGALVTMSLHFSSTIEYNLDLEFATMCFQIGFSPDCTP